MAVKEMKTIKKRSQFVSVWHRYKKNKLAMFGLILLAIMLLIAIFADFLVDYQSDVVEQHMSERLQGISSEHWLGTDQYGRDIFSRIIYGTRISLFIGLASVCISVTAGTIIGAIAGYYGGKVDNILMRIMDMFLAIPQMLMAIAIVAALGSGITNLLIALSISATPGFSRIVRSSIMSIKEQDFVEAAVAYGATDRHIILKHIIPNAIGPIIVQATLDIATAILTIASLSFIGLGIQSPTPEWGTILSEGKAQMRDFPHLIVSPGIAIILAVMALNLIGDGLRDALDPRMKN
jgi:peptide/nickel transport system permease protein